MTTARIFVVILSLAALAGCASLPPGADHPRTASTSLAPPLPTPLGSEAAAQAGAHPGLSGVRLFSRGIDGLVLRTQMVRAAQRTLDVQYYIFVEDYTGKVLLDAVVNAASAGCACACSWTTSTCTAGRRRVRRSPRSITDNLEIRVFNPFAYRGAIGAVHVIDGLLNAPRVNHRMHNKLMVADNAVALVGGRNVADDYFDVGDAPKRFGDFDLAVVGPAVPELSGNFDAFWNSALSIPLAALDSVPAPAGRGGEARGRGQRGARPAGACKPHRQRRAAALDDERPGSDALGARARWPTRPKSAEQHGRRFSCLPRRCSRRSFRTSRRARRDLAIPHSGRRRARGDPWIAPSVACARGRSPIRSRPPTCPSCIGVPQYREPLIDAGVELFEVRPAPGEIRDRKGLGSARAVRPSRCMPRPMCSTAARR